MKLNAICSEVTERHKKNLMALLTTEESAMHVS